jgi:nucleoid-associated protein EbfC
MRESSPAGYHGLARQARQLNDEVARLGDDLVRAEASGVSADGMVMATVSGNGTLVTLDIDPSVICPDDPAATAEPVLDAVNNALRALAARQQQRIAPLAESLKGISDRLSERQRAGQG